MPRSHAPFRTRFILCVGRRSIHHPRCVAPAFALAAALLSLAPTHPARATTWNNGDVITYSQELWGGNPATGAAKLLHDNFDNIYPAGLRVGTGFSIFYTNVIDLLGYLPASGAPNALASNLIDPSSSSSGEFGGAVTALKIDIDFSDANLTLGTAGVRFGDLFLHDFSALPALNGVTVRQFLDSANTALGGDSALYSITDLDSVTVDLNAAFIGGAATLFAQDHLSAPVPEPAISGVVRSDTGDTTTADAARTED